MLHRVLRLLFPPKCVLCKKLLSEHETDLCHDCRINAPVYSKRNFKVSFVARWTAVWYYKDNVRSSLLRYKFYGKRHYALTYGRLLAMKLQTARMDDFDVLTWVPVGPLRRLTRGYDQVELLANAVSSELGITAVKLLRKVRNTPPQSAINDAAKRRANVLNAYRVTQPDAVRGKRILLLDDVITTGSTLSECAKTLLTANAKEVNCATVAVACHDKKK